MDTHVPCFPVYAELSRRLLAPPALRIERSLAQGFARVSSLSRHRHLLTQNCGGTRLHSAAFDFQRSTANRLTPLESADPKKGGERVQTVNQLRGTETSRSSGDFLARAAWAQALRC